MKRPRRISAFILAMAMVFYTLPISALATETQTAAAVLCEHHPQHTAECGYTVGADGARL